MRRKAFFFIDKKRAFTKKFDYETVFFSLLWKHFHLRKTVSREASNKVKENLKQNKTKRHFPLFFFLVVDGSLIESNHDGLHLRVQLEHPLT